MILLDTHALLWWALDPDQLSTTAADLIAQMERRGGMASAISIWELGVKIQRGKLELGISIDKLAHRIERHSAVELVAVDTGIWLRSLALPWDHRDPADRVIVATALARGVPILTKDVEIRRFEGVETIW
ncbi:MAG: type II toxin-antitoxin system VapC family toxin [Deltaproteobacteria bacterium]|nr:type II toxin-antitoxin system VapC family toxin [Deltaproteobacteria bacterium]MDQ3298507.1 type II toxin-antitoxin system VapC family toxin [Myxococcota bacterium]